MKKILTLLLTLFTAVLTAQNMSVKATTYIAVTTAQRASIDTSAGKYPIIYNSDNSRYEKWNGAAWVELDPSTATEVNDLTSAVTWANIPDANVPESAVSQHIGTFAELDAIVADKNLANLNDNQTFTGEAIYNNNLRTNSNALIESTFYLSTAGLTADGWSFSTDGSNNFLFGANTGGPYGSFPTIASIAANGTPTAGTDLITKTYADANYSGGSGNVSNTGTPVNNQLAVWTDATTIEGDADLTWDGTSFKIGASTAARDFNVLSSSLVTTELASSTNGQLVDYRVYSDTPSFIGFRFNEGASSELTRAAVSWVTGGASAAGNIQFDKTWSYQADAALSVDLTNDRVGVGTSLPSYELDVSGTSAADDLFLTPTDTEPTATEGALYFDDSENTLKQYTGSTWDALVSETGTQTLTNKTFDAALNTLSNVAEADMDINNSPTDGQVLSWNQSAGKFAWANDSGGTPENDVYSASWDGDLDATSKNSIYDQMELRISGDSTGFGNAAYKPIKTLIVHDYSVSSTEPTLGTDEYAIQINGPSEEKSFVIPLGAVGADIATGTKVNFVPVHDAITITRVEAHMDTAPTGSVATFDINEDGTTILSTKLTIDATEKWSDDAATQAVISDTAIDAKSLLSVDIDGVGSTVAGKDATVTIYYTIDP